MPCYVGLDASKKLTAICILDARGGVVREGEAPSTPSDIARFLRGGRLRYARVGLEAWGMASWLYEGLARNGLPVICINPVHAHGALKTQPNKTDRADARGIAELMRTGSYRAVHIKTGSSQEAQAILTARRLLKDKIRDVENGVRGILLSFGLKLDRCRKTFERKARQLASQHPFVNSVIGPLLQAREAMLAKVLELEALVEARAAADPVCQLLKTAPGIGSLTALLFRATVDEPLRFSSSRSIGPHLGLVPRTHQSGEVEWRGRITKAGSSELRAQLYLAAMSLMRPYCKTSSLKEWGQRVAARRGRKRALIAVARRLAVTLHRMWITETPFRWSVEARSGVAV